MRVLRHPILAADDVLDGVVVEAPRIAYRGAPPPRGAVDVMSLLEVTEHAPGAVLLDVGCGDGEFRSFVAGLGYDWIGIDLVEHGPTLHTDVHALPLRDGSIDVAMSVAVLEHLEDPFAAVAEIRRVLKPGARFVGTAAFGEPFHASFFHMSAWGLAVLFRSQGFVVERLWPCRGTLAALSDMGGYPKAVRWLLRGVERAARVPVLSPRRWLRGDTSRAMDALATAGSIGFCVRHSGQHVVPIER
ncbi:MAG TPA: class I SAM-dependent methyltransferase [Vicinamibacterales bacterium]|nr:class I SAM-dependent methyltransferase [Vicinamibacterales bacterium]